MSPRVSLARGIAILEGALAIGHQADSLAPETAEARMEAAKAQASTVMPAGRGVFYGWLIGKKCMQTTA